jgi:hypothetical protein
VIANAGAWSREDLSARANRWVFLNYFRMIAGVLSFIFVMWAILQPAAPV